MIALAGNKIDLSNERQVTSNEAQAYADENGLLPFFLLTLLVSLAASLLLSITLAIFIHLCFTRLPRFSRFFLIVRSSLQRNQRQNRRKRSRTLPRYRSLFFSCSSPSSSIILSLVELQLALFPRAKVSPAESREEAHEFSWRVEEVTAKKKEDAALNLRSRWILSFFYSSSSFLPLS